MNKNKFFKKTLVYAIIALFFCVNITPSINAVIYNNRNEENSISEETNDIISNPLNSTINDAVASLSFYTFDKTGRKQNKIDLPLDSAIEIKNVFEELEYNIVYEAKSIETQELKNELINLLDEYGLLSEKQSRNEVFSLLNPNWLKTAFNNNSLGFRNPFIYNLFRSFFGSHFGISFFCSVSSGGAGLLMPLFMLPRPRAIGIWFSYDAVTSVANMVTGKGFLAGGVQRGLLLGFMGVGLTYAVPGVTLYGFIGYALFAGVAADYMEFYPPNNAPIISNENPLDNAVNIPLDLGELSFMIEDDDGDLMDYQVTTEPNIGSGAGTNKKNGIYKISVSGLESKTEYSWKVVVFDGKATVEKTFGFTTVAVEPVVSNPVPSDGQSEVPLSLSHLSFTLNDFQGDLMDYTVETSPDIGSGNGSGVVDGTYSVSVVSLELGVSYWWFVNVTDGTHWTRKIFVFETVYPLQFDPFDFGWQYRKKITIDHDMVTGDFVNFPVLISIIDVDLRDKAQYDGDDILFMESDGVAQPLNHEIECYDGDTGKLIAWVNVTIVSFENDTVFFIYYGNKNCLGKQDVVNTWDSDYVCVLHMNGASWDAIDDSTIYNNDVTGQTGSPTYLQAGKIGYGVVFGNYKYITFGNPVRNIFPLTAEVWANANSFAGGNYVITNGAEGHYRGFTLDFDGTGGAYYSSLVDGINDYRAEINQGSSTTNVWYYLTAKWSGSSGDNATFSKNTITYTAAPSSYPDAGTKVMAIGANIAAYPGEYGFKGCVDEVRISGIVRSEEWIETTYNTINDPSNFYSVGMEESHP